MKKVIEGIGKKVIDKFFDFDDNGFSFEGVFVEPHNEIREAESLSISFTMSVGKHDVDCFLNMTGKKVNSLEAVFADGGLDNIEEAVNEYILQNMNTDELMSLALDKTEEDSMDEYQRNGFSGYADYIGYINGIR